MELKTPLYQQHLEAGGSMVPFAGYLLPVQYSSIIAEHMAVREKAGLFDVSHMGEFLLEGPDTEKFLQGLLTGSVTGMKDGMVRYSPMCNEDGGTLDDLLVYRLWEQSYLLVVNAACREKDYAFIEARLSGDIDLTDVSEDYAQLALQGPNAQAVLEKVASKYIIPEKYYTFRYGVRVAGVTCLLSRTGYTGEDGFELYCDPVHAVRLWDALLRAGQEYGLVPCGLGARDTLRLEAGMPLYGHELAADITPLEAGLGFAVKLDKPEDFPGKQALQAAPPARKRIGLRLNGRRIAREGCDVFLNGELIGKTTSGTHLPYLGYPVAMALVKNDKYPVGTAVEVDVRGHRIPAEIVPSTFYKRVG